MRMSAREFAAHPSYDLVTRSAPPMTTRCASTPWRRPAPPSAPHRQLRAKVASLKGSFSDLVREQEGWLCGKGRTAREAPRAGSAVERIINEDLDQAAVAMQLLLISLLTMRRYEAQYRYNRDDHLRQHFADGFLNFNRRRMPSTSSPA